MLIDSPRLTDADRRVWSLREADDARRARSRGLAVFESRAIGVIRRYLADPSDCYVSTSWGKDSVTVAHLVRRVEPTVPALHVARRTGEAPNVFEGILRCRIQNPHCDDVRDAYLARWPMPYIEIDWVRRRESADAYVAREHGRRRIMGIRAQESGTRALSARVHGFSTRNVCRPILDWSTDDVFAYLHKYDLPIHPSYAMSDGGEIDREVLRVATIGGHEGVDRGRRDWERRYYGELLADNIAAADARDV